MGEINDLLTTREVASVASLTVGRIQQLVSEGRLRARLATTGEVAGLLVAGRIGGIPPSGIRVFEAPDVARFLAGRRGKSHD